MNHPFRLAWLMPVFVLSATAADRVPVTLVNYSPWPVHATAVELDASNLCARLGRPAGSPLRVAAGSLLLPQWRDGSRIHVLVSLAPTSRLDLVAGPAEQWPHAPRFDAPPGELDNGILRFSMERRGWRLGFAADKAGLIEGGELDFWVDTQNRGRLTNPDPAFLKPLGLVRFADIPAPPVERTTGASGQPALQRIRQVGGLTVTETFELRPGQPVLVCRVTWRNDTDTPRWIAYVGSGNGISGRWSKELMARPLIQRKKSPVLGDIDGSETRCAWVGGLCRVSMESPATGCGVGLSTLLPTPGQVGQGSMIWGCGGYSFQCNFIDPVQGQFPFRIEPRSTLTNGFAFLAAQAGVSVHRQTVALWSSLQKEIWPALPPPCAVFVGGDAVSAQTVPALPDQPGLWLEHGSNRIAALRFDFNKTFAVQADTPTTIAASRLDGRKTPAPVLRVDTTNAAGVDLNGCFGVTDEVAFVLSAPLAARLRIVETLPNAPELLSPPPDAQVTDFAAMYRWKALPMVTDYELQLATDAGFVSPVGQRITSSEPYPHILPADDRLPAPGRWYWRVRGLKAGVTGAWSEVRAFTVNADHTTKPLKRPLTPERPLFTLEATRVLDYTAFQPDIPADIAPYIGIVAEGFEAKGMTVGQFARGMDRLPYAFLLRSHWVGLADIEWLFQHVPNFAGIQGGEHLSDLYQESPRGEMRYAHRLLRLCAKYGMFFQEADGTYKDDKWQLLMDKQGAFIRRHGPWLVLAQKNNIIRRQFYSQSAAMGLWLGGVTHQHGAWEDGGFYWQNAGFKELGTCAGERSGELRTMPRIFWDLVCVMGIARGCGIYSLDGQTLMDSAKLNARDPKAAWASAIWDDTGRTTETFSRFVVPLIRATVKHELIPSREEVLGNVRIAVFNDMKGKGNVQAWPHYAEYGPLYAGTYGFRTMGQIDGQLWEFFPNAGRYYFIPVLPQGDEPLGPGIRNLPVSQLQEVAKATETFNAAHPQVAAGDAFATCVGDTLVVLNTREDEDATETFSLPVSAGIVTNLAGRLPPHAYVLAKTGSSLWLQANGEYADRAFELRLGCPRRPDVSVQPPASVVATAWDEAANELRLRLSPRPGAIEVEAR